MKLAEYERKSEAFMDSLRMESERCMAERDRELWWGRFWSGAFGFACGVTRLLVAGALWYALWHFILKFW